MVRSFGRAASEPEPEPGAEAEPAVPVAGRLRLEVELVLSPGCLDALERQLSDAVAAAVRSGFARAPGGQ